jgi:hypothetical protein
MNIKHIILLLLVPLSEIKSIFYNSNLKVDWYILSDHSKFLCNVLKDYFDHAIIAVIFYYVLFVKFDIITRQIFLYLFVLTCLDFIHLALNDMQDFLVLKLVISIIITTYVINGKFKSNHKLF